MKLLHSQNRSRYKYDLFTTLFPSPPLRRSDSPPRLIRKHVESTRSVKLIQKKEKRIENFFVTRTDPSRNRFRSMALRCIDSPGRKASLFAKDRRHQKSIPFKSFYVRTPSGGPRPVTIGSPTPERRPIQCPEVSTGTIVWCLDSRRKWAAINLARFWPGRFHRAFSAVRTSWKS